MTHGELSRESQGTTLETVLIRPSATGLLWNIISNSPARLSSLYTVSWPSETLRLFKLFNGMNFPTNVVLHLDVVLHVIVKVSKESSDSVFGVAKGTAIKLEPRDLPIPIAYALIIF